MVRLAIAAAVTLVGVVVGGILVDATAAPDGVAVVAGILASAGAALGGPRAIDTLIALIPRPVHDELVFYVTIAIGALESIQLATLAFPVWLHVTLGALIAAAGMFVRRGGVTPLSRPRDVRGHVLATRTATRT